MAPEHVDVVDLAANDIEEGLSQFFSAQGPSGGFKRADFVEPYVNGGRAWVPWTFSGVHDKAAFAGLHPTGRPVEVHGVTLVDTTTDPPLFRRYIDWIDVCQQLGLSVTARPAMELRRA
jgi:hypothetical protein